MKRKLRPEPVLIGLLCLGPLALAAFLYYGPFQLSALPRIRNPERVLIQPPRRLPAVALPAASGKSAGPHWFRKRWSLIYATMSPCDHACLLEVNRLSQVYFALGGDRTRTRRVFLFGGTPKPPFEGGADMLVASLDGPAGARLVQVLGRDKITKGRIFVADPRGNLILSYPPDADRAHLLKDLKRLLGHSGVG